ncbi:hypothetical protein [Butyrivibrio sp. FCS014]|uniref:hypothetical protein n=1 Tax=Butyrivibrio sp. FCS014 TaxID=1408304 RepID=UPI0004678950|nr:hypothetical protein [Butyrivibrio sp. FCS014]
MFSYKLYAPKFKLNKKLLMMCLGALYLIGVIPMMVIGFYNWPSVDDFSMPLQVHQTFVSTGSVLATLGSVFTKTVYIYNNWVGYFFSDFVTCLCPSIWGEKWYFLSGIIVIATLTLCVLYFFDALFVRTFGFDKDLSLASAFLTLLVMVQSMENGAARAEAFFWWSGAINYTFMFGLCLFWIGLALRYVFEKCKLSRLVLLCVLGFLLGGSNYMTALVAAVCSVLGLIIVIMVKLGKFKLWSGSLKKESVHDDIKRINLPWLPFILNLLGLIVSAAAPGNRIRGTGIGNIGPIKAVLRAYFSVFDVCVDGMLRWEVILEFAVLAVLFWKMAPAIKNRLEHPFVFGLFSISMMAVCMVPPLFAVGNIDAPRIRSTMWLQFVLMMTVTIFYYMTWIRQRIDDGSDAKTPMFGQISSAFIIVIVCVLLLGSLLCVYVNPAYYSGTSAIYDLVNGKAAAYRQENEARLEILNDNSVSVAVLQPHDNKPELLFQGDIYEDATLWENTALAAYYDKESVMLEKR